MRYNCSTYVGWDLVLFFWRLVVSDIHVFRELKSQLTKLFSLDGKSNNVPHSLISETVHPVMHYMFWQSFIMYLNFWASKCVMHIWVIKYFICTKFKILYYKYVISFPIKTHYIPKDKLEVNTSDFNWYIIW